MVWMAASNQGAGAVNHRSNRGTTGLFAFLLLTLAGICLAPAAAAAPPTFNGPLTTSGRQFKDPEGRVVIMHGLMGVWKQSPYAPAGDELNPNGPQFLDSDADIMKAMGLNSMRLAWYWESLEPTKGVYDSTYLDRVSAVQTKLAQRGMYSVLDAHQDQYNKTFGDKPGLPQWTTPTDVPVSIPPLVIRKYQGLDTAPPSSNAGYAAWKFPLGYTHPSTSLAFANLYGNQTVTESAGLQNSGPVRDEFGDAWAYVANRFKNEPMVAGYDLMNEPWPSNPDGTTNADCQAETGCAAWDQDVLQPFYEALAAKVRSADPNLERPVFFEPDIFFNAGSANHFATPPASLGTVGLSFHNQCSTRTKYSLTKDPAVIQDGYTVCPPQEARTMHNAEVSAAALGGPPLMTEVAPTADADSRGLNCLLERSDYVKTGFTYGLSWSNPNMELRHLDSDSTPDGKAPFKQQVLSRVYPRATAGTIDSFNFDVRTGHFNMTYMPDRKVTADTVISVPTSIQYPAGYDVTVTNGHVTSAANADELTIAADGPAKVTVTMVPSAGDTLARPDWPACDLDPNGDLNPPPPDVTPVAKVISINPKTVKALRRKRAFTVRVRFAGPTTLKARFDVRKKVAKKLHIPRKIAAVSKAVKKASTLNLKIRVKKKTLKALKGRHRLPMTFGYSADGKGGFAAVAGAAQLKLK